MRSIPAWLCLSIIAALVSLAGCAPKIPAGVVVVSAAEAKAMQAAGKATVVDASPGGGSAATGVLSIPGDKELDPTALPADKNRPIVVQGRHSLDPLALKVSGAIAAQGYREVHVVGEPKP